MSGGPGDADPKGLIGEAFRMPGITAAECRSIFLDWALSLPPGRDPAAAAAALLEAHSRGAPDADKAGDGHPMLAVLREGAAAAPATARRRGGWRGRPRPGSA